MPLPTPLFAPICNLYVGLGAAVWSVTVAPTSTTSIPIPNGTDILGLAFGLQALALLPDPLIVSNGLSDLVGNFGGRPVQRRCRAGLAVCGCRQARKGCAGHVAA